jgi:hypothetical protein
LYGVSIIGGVVLVFFPLQFYLYAGFCCGWALIHTIDGGRILGILLYVLGLSFAFKQGCFKTFPKVKGLLSSLFLLAAMVSQVRYGMAMETLLLLQRLLAGDKYDPIADKCGMGLSTLKKLLVSIGVWRGKARSLENILNGFFYINYGFV